MGLIKAKSNGLDLSSHTHSVMNSAYIINDMGGFGLDKQILKYASILDILIEIVLSKKSIALSG